MSNQDNSFGGADNSYTTTMTFGSQPAPAGNGAAAPDDASLIKDTTTSGFAADVLQESRRQPVLVDFWAPGAVPASNWLRRWRRWSSRRADASSWSR